MKDFYSITQVSFTTGYSTQNIRALDAAGIIRPIRDSSGRRIFTDQDIQLIIKHRDNRQKDK